MTISHPNVNPLAAAQSCLSHGPCLLCELERNIFLP